jgi:hypothetical protein
MTTTQLTTVGSSPSMSHLTRVRVASPAGVKEPSARRAAGEDGMPGLVLVVADYAPDDETLARLKQRLELVAPQAEVMLTQVAPCDSLAAGFCVARLALDDGLEPRVVVHDVRAPDAARAKVRECAGWAGHGVTIVGPDAGWSWSFVAPEISGPCYLELMGADASSRSPELLAAAIVRGVMRHPHALRERVPPEAMPALPERVVAYVDRLGNLATTITQLPAATGARVRVRIGDASATAVLSDGSLAVAGEEVIFGPASVGPRSSPGGRCPFLELSIPGGSAADRFHSPPVGSHIDVEAK